VRLVVALIVHALRAGKRRRMSRLFAAAAEIHPMGCTCSSCEPYVPSAPHHLDVQAKAKLAIAAAIVGTAIAFFIDPAGAAAALAATVLP
jgi:hypothetical protein